MTRRRLLLECLEERILLAAPTVTVTEGPVRDPVAAGTYRFTGEAGTFTVPTFQDVDPVTGAHRKLLSVTFNTTLTLHDGIYKWDNEGALPVVVTLTMWTQAGNYHTINSVLDPLLVTDAETITAPVARDSDLDGNPDGDLVPDMEPEFGGDAIWLRGRLATDPNPVTASDTDSLSLAGADVLDDFIRSISGPTVAIDYDSQSFYTHQGLNLTGAFGPDPPPQYFSTATVTYEYIPEPAMDIIKGIVATDGGGSFTRRIGPPALTWSDPTTPGLRWAGGIITSATTAASPINSDLVNARQGDLVTYAIMIENLGGGENGAFDVRLRDAPFPEMAIPPTGLNLHVADGTGAIVPFTVIGGGLFDPAGGIEIDDPGPTDPPAGGVDYYEPDSGRNIIIVTYDMEVVGDIAGRVFPNTATLFWTAEIDAGGNLLLAPLTDPAYVSGPPTYVTDWFDRAGGILEKLPVRSTVYQPLYSGTAEPGSTLQVDVYDRRGDLIGSETTVTDAGGNWMTNFFNTFMQDEPHSIVVRQTYAGYNALADAGYNLRTYYTPAIQGGTFISEHLTVENVLGKRSAATAVDALYAASMYPITLGWHVYPFEFLAQSATPSGI